MDKIARTIISRALSLIIIMLAADALAAMPEIHGFVEADYGIKLSDDTTKRDNFNFLEQRLQLKVAHFFEGKNYLSDKNGAFNFKGDFTVDEYYSGKTDFELRELSLSLTPFDFMDLNLGRQILTWGTGDYIFLNDLFPKDYISFFIGRDDEYLKKPSDAVRALLYPDWFNIDLAFVPFFEPNITPKGDRLSFFDSFQGGIAGRDSDRDILEPSRRVKNFLYAARAYRSFGSYEGALYFYRGFDPSPRSFKNELARQIYYERLDAYGASARGPVFKGIGNAEISYYYSPEDSEGNIRTIQNSMMKYLLGYDKDLGNNLSVGFQYYLEQTLDYSEYQSALLANDFRWDEFRHVITNRVTKYFINQTVKLSCFTFFSPSDLDLYTRPSVTWNITDSWTLTAGANLPWGTDDITEFGHMERNKNIFARVRYSF
ncbi:hypothetical protein ACFL0T_06950 [Candidatus Omnitrophota bacterium]